VTDPSHRRDHPARRLRVITHHEIGTPGTDERQEILTHRRSGGTDLRMDEQVHETVSLAEVRCPGPARRIAGTRSHLPRLTAAHGHHHVDLESARQRADLPVLRR
jgi:hypothetical protein